MFTKRQMKLVLVSADIPYPPSNGGRVEVWRRLRTLHAAGWRTGLICWYDKGRVPEPSADQIEALLGVCDWIEVIPIDRSPSEIAKRLLRLWREPSHVASRRVTCPMGKMRTKVASFSPDAVFLDGLYGASVAQDLCARLRLPLLYRSHNIEHAYMRAQYEREGRLKSKLGLLANMIGLRRYERSVIGKSTAVLDISLADQQYWTSVGFDQVEWLPPSVDQDFVQDMGAAAPIECDVLYFGNLNTPNNVEGVLWFVREVLPRLSSDRLRIWVAGSRPLGTVREALRTDERIRLIENPPNMAGVLRSARVIVNPVQAGSGVNIKAIEMLFSSAHLVSTTAGAAGLPEQAQACFSVADKAEKFAAAIDAALLTNAGPDLAGRAQARQTFANSQIATRIARAVRFAEKVDQ